MYSFEMSMFLQYIMITQKDERGMNHMWSKCVLRLNVLRRAGNFLTRRGKVWYNFFKRMMWTVNCCLSFYQLSFRGERKLQRTATKGRTYGSPLDSNSLVTLAVPR